MPLVEIMAQESTCQLTVPGQQQRLHILWGPTFSIQQPVRVLSNIIGKRTLRIKSREHSGALSVAECCQVWYSSSRSWPIVSRASSQMRLANCHRPISGHLEFSKQINPWSHLPWPERYHGGTS